MTAVPLPIVAAPSRARSANCWSSIGVHGDRSCPELTQHAHCRHCPRYRAAAPELLRSEPPDDYLAESSAHSARPRSNVESAATSLLIFRLATEWFALPTTVISETTIPRPVHSLPHRRNPAVLGLVNIRGELLVCASLRIVLGLEGDSSPTDGASRTVYPRLLVLRRAENRAVSPVDEVDGVHPIDLKTVRSVPATMGAVSTAHTKGVLPWRERSVGLLDEERLFATLKGSLA